MQQQLGELGVIKESLPEQQQNVHLLPKNMMQPVLEVADKKYSS